MKSSNVFYHLLFVNLFEEYFCETNKTFGIPFLPVSIQRNDQSMRTIEIQPEVKIGSTAGYSFCLTVNFMTWDKNCLIKSNNFELIFNHYQVAKGTGILRNRKFEHSFRWENIIEISYTLWNTICAVYNGINKIISLDINGEQVK